MSKRVGIIGVGGVTPFKGTWREKTYYELAQMSAREAVEDAGIEIQDVDGACREKSKRHVSHNVGL